MKKFFLQIFNKIKKFDDYTNQYLKITNNIEMPSFAYTNWGIYYVHLKDFDTAIEKLETAVMMSDVNPKPCISLGIIYAKLKQFDKAEAILNEAIKRDSQNSYTYSLLSSVFVSKEKYVQAEDALKKALKLAPSDPDVFLNYGILYAKTQRRHKAVEMLKKSKSLNPLNPHVYFILGVMLFETNKISEAFVEFKHLEKMSPEYKNLSYYLALCNKKEKNYRLVEYYGQKAIRENDLNPAPYILLAQNYITLSNPNEAIAIFNNALAKGIDDFELYLAFGITLLKEMKIEEAKEQLNKALNKKPDDSNTLYRLGSCYLKEKNFALAEEFFIKSINKDEKNTNAISELGMLYYEQKDYGNAINTFFKAINLSAGKTYLYFYIANCYFKAGRFKKSLEYYSKTIDYYPSHLEALINYSVNLLYINNEKEALRKIRSAYQINRDSEKVLLIYALACLKTGLYKDSIEKTDMLLEKNPENKDAKLIRAHAYLNLNKPLESLSTLYSLKESEQDSELCTYLLYLSYKKLVDISESNYNKNMLNKYFIKLNMISKENNEINKISAYIDGTIGINKG